MHNDNCPQLRHVEARPSSHHPGAVELVDPSGIAESVITVSGRTLAIISQLNGRNRRADIQAEYMRRFGRMLFSDELDKLLCQLDEAHFLIGPRFDDHMIQLTKDYRNAEFRPLRDSDAFGAPAAKLAEYLDSIINSRPVQSSVEATGRLLGLVAPHLDYARGAPCYSLAYRDLPSRTSATRFVILGTNHFGRAPGVVGTLHDFETPWGVVPHDRLFMERVAARCGADLHEFEYDHLREHSVELQVILLKHLLTDREFTIAPYLCPDICGPEGTAPRNGNGVDLHQFAEILGELIEEDDVPTCIIAGADLSHVGRYFQDERELNIANLNLVERWDRDALQQLEKGHPRAFRQQVAERSNSTNICSVGCLYALGAALRGRTQPTLLGYHQALTPEIENCVTCAAMEYRES